MKTILITKQNGEISAYHDDLENILTLLPNGEHTIQVLKTKSQRSVAQNSLLWLWLEHIAQEIGSTREDMHDYYCKKFLQRQIKVDTHIETVVGGTRNLTKDDFATFLEQIKNDAVNEFGIKLPDPSDNQFQRFQNHYNTFIQS